MSRCSRRLDREWDLGVLGLDKRQARRFRRRLARRGGAS